MGAYATEARSMLTAAFERTPTGTLHEGTIRKNMSRTRECPDDIGRTPGSL